MISSCATCRHSACSAVSFVKVDHAGDCVLCPAVLLHGRYRAIGTSTESCVICGALGCPLPFLFRQLRRSVRSYTTAIVFFALNTPHRGRHGAAFRQ